MKVSLSVMLGLWVTAVGFASYAGWLKSQLAVFQQRFEQEAAERVEAQAALLSERLALEQCQQPDSGKDTGFKLAALEGLR